MFSARTESWLKVQTQFFYFHGFFASTAKQSGFLLIVSFINETNPASLKEPVPQISFNGSHIYSILSALMRNHFLISVPVLMALLELFSELLQFFI